MGGGTHYHAWSYYMTIDPRIPTMPGWRASGFYRPGRHCLHQGRSAARCWASRMKKGELHPLRRTAFEEDFLAYG